MDKIQNKVKANQQKLIDQQMAQEYERRDRCRYYVHHDIYQGLRDRLAENAKKEKPEARILVTKKLPDPKDNCDTIIEGMLLQKYSLVRGFGLPPAEGFYVDLDTKTHFQRRF